MNATTRCLLMSPLLLLSLVTVTGTVRPLRGINVGHADLRDGKKPQLTHQEKRLGLSVPG